MPRRMVGTRKRVIEQNDIVFFRIHRAPGFIGDAQTRKHEAILQTKWFSAFAKMCDGGSGHSGKVGATRSAAGRMILAANEQEIKCKTSCHPASPPVAPR